MAQTSIIVIGTLNTDIIAAGVDGFPAPGHQVFGGKLKIGPGGKSRNIAQMIGSLVSESSSVAMIGRTSRDKYGLWKAPVEALEGAGINTTYVKVDDAAEFPGIALLAVDQNGNNQSFVVPGGSTGFSIQDIEDADMLFQEVGNCNGFLVLSIECPLETAAYAVNKANGMGVRVILDPGGIDNMETLQKLTASKFYLIKPNEQEAEALTGIKVTDSVTAQNAAALLKDVAENVLITVGVDGAYLFTENEELHIPIPELNISAEKDETGCGDQTIAALCTFLQDGRPLGEASKLAVLAGTLQFSRLGIQPITRQDLLQYL